MTVSRTSDTAGDREQDEAQPRALLVGAGRWRNQQLRQAEYVDIRDDRVQRYFSLRAGEIDLLRDAAECRVSRQVLSTGRQHRSHVRRHAACEAEGPWVEVVSPDVSVHSPGAGAWRHPRPPPHARGGGRGRCSRLASGSGRLLPEPLFDAPLSYVLEARDGTLLSARIAADGQWRFPPRATVPVKFRRALLVFEDKRFERSHRRRRAGHRARDEAQRCSTAAW